MWVRKSLQANSNIPAGPTPIHPGTTGQARTALLGTSVRCQLQPNLPVHTGCPRNTTGVPHTSRPVVRGAQPVCLHVYTSSHEHGVLHRRGERLQHAEALRPRSHTHPARPRLGSQGGVRGWRGGKQGRGSIAHLDLFRLSVAPCISGRQLGP